MLLAAAAHAAGPADAPLTHLAADGEERILVLLPAAGFQAPEVEVLGGDEPRLVADFAGVTAWAGPAALEVNSALVLRVRTWLHTGEARLRVVADLAAPPQGLLLAHTYEPGDGVVRVIFTLRALDRP